MKIENLSQELKEKVKQLLESAPADQKADAIMQSIEMIEEAAHLVLFSANNTDTFTVNLLILWNSEF